MTTVRRQLQAWIVAAAGLLAWGNAWCLEMQQAMDTALREEGLAGAAWATVIPPAVETGSAGLRDLDTRMPMADGDRVQVGSVAKPLLAAGVLRLVSEGRLTLETPVEAMLPGVRFRNPWATTDPVRVIHLLEHTAGIDNLQLWQFFSLRAKPDTPLAALFARDKGVLQVRTRPGSRFAYSNLGYALLGMTIEAVVGERYETWLDRELLAPLGMHDSTFGFVSQRVPHADPRLAMGHFENGQAQPAIPLPLRPAAQFTTTAGDMARFARFLLGDGHVGGRRFVDPALLARIGRPVGTEAAGAGLRIGHGLLATSRDRHGVIGACHPGNTVGYRAMLCVYPGQGKAWFVAVNSDSETADYARIDALLVDAVRPAPPKPQPTGAPARDLSEWDGFYVRDAPVMRRFAWVDWVFGVSRVRWTGAWLDVRPLPGPARRLAPAGGRLLRAEDRLWPSHALLVGEDGRRVLTDGLRSQVRVPAWQPFALWSSLLLGVLGAGHVLVAGVGRALGRRLRRSDPLAPMLLALAFLPLPVLWLLKGPVLQFGDRTAANLLLALATALLPLAALVGLWYWRSLRRAGAGSVLDGVALAAVLQCLCVLASWGLLPLRLWA